MASDEDYRSESEFYYPDETENYNEKENISLGRSVLGKTVPEVLHTARGSGRVHISTQPYPVVDIF